jgi:hypothetical protein
MFFKRPKRKPPTFSERVEILKQAGFATQQMADGRVTVSKNGVAAIVGNEGKNQTALEKAGVVINGGICTLYNSGYQMFLETPDGNRIPARAEQLKQLHEFEEDVKEALGLVDLYNTSLGTTTPKHMYDRVYKRDIGQQPTPWVTKDNAYVAPDTKESEHPYTKEPVKLTESK